MTCINIPATKFSAIQIYDEGRDAVNSEKDDRESTKKHILRVGDAGCITNYGEFIGANPHKALARFMGFQTKIQYNSYNIFDNGHANEKMWDEYLARTLWAHKADEDFPLVDKENHNYPLTGRPDGVLGEYLWDDKDLKFVPSFGVEHKAICSGSTAKTIFDTHSPKTENLIQAATYSMGFNLPWLLVYTSNSNYNYSKHKAGKVEFPMAFEDDKLVFYKPSGEKINTVITGSGIRAYYDAICEAYDTKDHSFFRREAIDYQGAPYQNWDDYDTFNLMVDKSWEWSKWVERAEQASQSDKIITFGKVNRKPTYSLFDVSENRVLKTFSILADARKELYK